MKKLLPLIFMLPLLLTSCTYKYSGPNHDMMDFLQNEIHSRFGIDPEWKGKIFVYNGYSAELEKSLREDYSKAKSIVEREEIAKKYAEKAIVAFENSPGTNGIDLPCIMVKNIWIDQAEIDGRTVHTEIFSMLRWKRTFFLTFRTKRVYDEYRLVFDGDGSGIPRYYPQLLLNGSYRFLEDSSEGTIFEEILTPKEARELNERIKARDLAVKKENKEDVEREKEEAQNRTKARDEYIEKTFPILLSVDENGVASINHAAAGEIRLHKNEKFKIKMKKNVPTQYPLLLCSQISLKECVYGIYPRFAEGKTPEKIYVKLMFKANRSIDSYLPYNIYRRIGTYKYKNAQGGIEELPAYEEIGAADDPLPLKIPPFVPLRN